MCVLGTHCHDCSDNRFCDDITCPYIQLLTRPNEGVILKWCPGDNLEMLLIHYTNDVFTDINPFPRHHQAFNYNTAEWRTNTGAGKLVFDLCQA